MHTIAGIHIEDRARKGTDKGYAGYASVREAHVV